MPAHLTGVSLRRAVVEDSEAIVKLQAKSIQELGKSHYEQAVIDAWCDALDTEIVRKAISERFVVVAEENAKLCGFGTLNLEKKKIQMLYVDPQFAGRGIGSMIIDAMIEEARRQGLLELTLESSLNAIAFYQKHGFVVLKETSHEFSAGGSIASALMVRRLQPVS